MIRNKTNDWPVTRLEAIDICAQMKYNSKRPNKKREAYRLELHLKQDDELVALHNELTKDTMWPDNIIHIVPSPTIRDDTRVKFNNIKQLSYTESKEDHPTGIYVDDKFIGTVQVLVTLNFDKLADDNMDVVVTESDWIKFIILNKKTILLKDIKKQTLN
jgi:hypothetical protein